MSWTIINTIFFLYNICNDTRKRVFDTATNIYRLCTEKPTWFILDNGQFANSSLFNVVNRDKYWIYDGENLIKNSTMKAKKLPYLSFEFNYEDNIVTMDEFIENTKYKDTAPPPLPVLMSAFSIFNKSLYPWPLASFTAYNKMGDRKEFSGTDLTIPE